MLNIQQKFPSVHVCTYICIYTHIHIHKIYVQHDGNEGQYNLSSTFYTNGNSIDDRYKINLNDLDKLSLYEIHYSSYGCDIITQRTYNKDEYIADLNKKMASETEEVMKDEKLKNTDMQE